MQITIQTLSGKRIPLEVFPGITVKQVKELLNNSEGIPANQIRLMFQGKQLMDSRQLEDHEVDFTLADYAIPEQAQLHMVLRMRG